MGISKMVRTADIKETIVAFRLVLALVVSASHEVAIGHFGNEFLPVGTTGI
jgi:hypothetical protein